MELIIGNFKVRTLDDLNLVLEENKTVEEKDRTTMAKTGVKRKAWVFVGYFGKLNHALNRVLEARINRSDTNTLVDLQKLVEGSREAILDEVRDLVPSINTQSERKELRKNEKRDTISNESIDRTEGDDQDDGW